MAQYKGLEERTCNNWRRQADSLQFTADLCPVKAYLPNSDPGQSVLKLLLKAWKKLLIITMTEAEQDDTQQRLNFGDITNKMSILNMDGDPDPDYLDQVTPEPEG